MQYNYSKLPERPQFIELHDELNVKDNKRLNKLIPDVEKIYFSGQIVKINARSKPQKRILIVTNRGVYNIHPRHTIASKFAYWFSPSSSIKRRIGASKVDSATISADPKSDQFVLHMKGEYDYLFDGIGKREKIIKALTQLHCPIFGDSFTLYIKEEADLRTFRTTEEDFKAGVQKKPIDGKLQLSQQLPGGSLSWVIQNHLRTKSAHQSRHGSSYDGPDSMYSLPDTESHTPGTTSTLMAAVTANQMNMAFTPYSAHQAQFVPPYQNTFDRTKAIETIEDINMTSSVKVQIQPTQPSKAKIVSENGVMANFTNQIQGQNQNMSTISRI